MTKPRLDQGADYERGFVDGAQHQMKSSVDLALEAMRIKKWIELTDEEIKSCWNWETDCQEWAIEFARAILRKAQGK